MLVLESSISPRGWGRSFVVLLAVTYLAVDAQKLAAAQPINEFCPVLTEEKADPKITTTYKGKVVAFCCDRCLAKFEADPERYADRLPQFAEASEIPGTRRDAGSSDAVRRGQDAAASTEDAGRAAADRDRHDHPAAETEDEAVPFLGRLHPVIVHFPVAGLPLALLGFLVWVLTRHEAFAKADIPPLAGAAVAAVAAVITGNIAHDAMRFSGSLHEIVERHQFVGTTVMVIVLVLAAFRVWRWNRMTGVWRGVYGGALLVACVLVGVTGYLGGSLVFGPDHFRW
jgi:uncharacterized membrane protein/YHS domain-containing protein